MLFKNALKFTIKNENYLFRTLRPNDVDDKYIESLRLQQDYIVLRSNNITINLQKKYIRKILNSHSNTICGLFLEERLMGTAGIQSLIGKKQKNTATMGFFVLDPDQRGRGYGKTMIWAATTLSKLECRVPRIEAGMLLENVPSLKAFLSCGFELISEFNGVGRVGISVANIKVPNFIGEIQIIQID